MPIIDKTLAFRTTLLEVAPTIKTRILSEPDSTGVVGIFVGNDLVGWFDDCFAEKCDCYLSISRRDLANDLLNAIRIHSERSGQTILIDEGRRWQNYVR